MWFSAISLALAAPLPVAHTDRVLDDLVAGRVPVRVYFPVDGTGTPDRGSGPFPLAVLLHGWLGAAWMYDGVCERLASEGFVVVSLDTETGLVLDMERFADDAVAALHGLDAASATPGDPLEGMVADEAWTALGHSMGGATLFHLLGLEPRVRTAVAFMPYEGYPAYHRELAAFDGSLLLLSGTSDTTAPVALQQGWFADVDAAARALWVTTPDMGHQAVLDLSFDEDPMPDDTQRELVTGWAVDFVVAEHRGDEDRWYHLVGPGTEAVDARLASRSAAPVLWARPDGGGAELGLAGRPGDVATVSVNGAVAAELALTDGTGRARIAVPADGVIAISAVLATPDGAVSTREVGWGAPAGDPPTGDGGEADPPAPGVATDGSPDEPAGDAVPARGCSTTGRSGTAAVLGLGSILFRRRRARR